MDKALELLRELAGKLGQTVESLWPAVVAYNAAFALTTVLGWLIPTIILWTVFYCHRKQGWVTEDEDGPTFKLLALIAGAVASICLFIAFAHQIPIILNPIGYTVSQIIK